MSLAEASSVAPSIDRLFLILLLGGGSVILLVGILVLVFAVRYRRGSSASRAPLPAVLGRDIEIGWTVATAFVFLFIGWFAIAAQVPQFELPPRAMTMHIVAKQWMWKAEHPSGAREIDALTVPAGVPIVLVMTSQDVIHSFFVPAFRIKQDVLPGRYTSLWFKATRPGDYRLFCAEYCGTDHARMTGWVHVLQPEAYARWTRAQPVREDPVAAGARLYRSFGCGGCHDPGARVAAPRLAGLYGHLRPLATGASVVADENYLRDAIMMPSKDVAAGYTPVMPSYAGAMSEEQAIALIAWIRANGGAR